MLKLELLLLIGKYHQVCILTDALHLELEESVRRLSKAAGERSYAELSDQNGAAFIDQYRSI